MYQRKPTRVQAWQFTGQPYSLWPEWVKTAKVNTSIGFRSPSVSAVGTVTVPAKVGSDLQALHGDWLVLDGLELALVKSADFDAQFEPAPTAE